ncbi:MAG: NAD(P)H-dependent oxidoreductase, partial [Muribaculaceae bacterium]|nr:NAD(P)H-dependent oxidoreductase [Muribaculaceae bacterium]
MKVLAINGSSRQKGNTSKIIEVIFEELRQRDIECDLIELANCD